MTTWGFVNVGNLPRPCSITSFSHSMAELMGPAQHFGSKALIKYDYINKGTVHRCLAEKTADIHSIPEKNL